MKQLELWRWTIRDPDTGRVHRTRYVMSAENAMLVDPHAQRVPGTLEVRLVVDDDPLTTSSTGWAMRGMPLLKPPPSAPGSDGLEGPPGCGPDDLTEARARRS